MEFCQSEKVGTLDTQTRLRYGLLCQNKVPKWFKSCDVNRQTRQMDRQYRDRVKILPTRIKNKFCQYAYWLLGALRHATLSFCCLNSQQSGGAF